MNTYFYISGAKGLSKSGFTKYMEKWIIFSESDKKHFEENGMTPYGTPKTKTGKFINTNKYV